MDGRSLTPPPIPPPHKRFERGRWAEALAARFLKQQKLHCLQRNFYRRGGEIDLICFDRAASCYVFVEVRYRDRQDFGGSLGSLSVAKQRRLRRTALLWLGKYASHEAAARIDLLAIEGPGNTNPRTPLRGETPAILFEGYRIVWIENAV